MHDATHDLLTLFVEKGHYIRDSRFAKLLESDGFHAHVTFTGGDEGAYTVDYTDLEREAVEAFVLTFRFFIQKSEPISLHRIDAIDDPDLSNKWKEETRLVQEWFTVYLAATTTPTMVFQSQAVTREERDTVE